MRLSYYRNVARTRSIAFSVNAVEDASLQIDPPEMRVDVGHSATLAPAPARGPTRTPGFHGKL